MPIKNLLHRFQPVQLYIMLVLSICYFSAQLLLSQVTHALTVLIAAYHMLCNIFALLGCIATIKHSKQRASQSEFTNKSIPAPIDAIKIVAVSAGKNATERREIKLRNTFGWTRIDILTMLIVCIILASLSFSLLIEALQTLINIDHKDAMQWPIPMLLLGFAGLVLNGLSYLLIGGYTMHQGSFLRVMPSGDIVLDHIGAELSLKSKEDDFAKTNNDQHLHDDLQAEIGKLHYISKRQGSIELLRDASSTIFVIICALTVYMAEDDEHTAKFVEYIDPILAIFSCVLLVALSYPYMKQSCLILLQTIPDSINKEIIERTLVTKFPQILSFHDLHIWQLSAHKNIATVHMKFDSARLYNKVIEEVRAYFHEQGISQLTIQPEFHCARAVPSLDCLVRCRFPECSEKFCCKETIDELHEVSICANGKINAAIEKREDHIDTNAKPTNKVALKNDSEELESAKDLKDRNEEDIASNCEVLEQAESECPEPVPIVDNSQTVTSNMDPVKQSNPCQ